MENGDSITPWPLTVEPNQPPPCADVVSSVVASSATMAGSGSSGSNPADQRTTGWSQRARVFGSTHTSTLLQASPTRQVRFAKQDPPSVPGAGAGSPRPQPNANTIQIDAGSTRNRWLTFETIIVTIAALPERINSPHLPKRLRATSLDTGSPHSAAHHCARGRPSAYSPTTR